MFFLFLNRLNDNTSFFMYRLKQLTQNLTVNCTCYVMVFECKLLFIFLSLAGIFFLLIFFLQFSSI